MLCDPSIPCREPHLQPKASSPPSQQKHSPSKLPPISNATLNNSPKSLLSGPLLEILVGAEKKRWTIHRNLLVHHSPYFSSESDDLGNEQLDLQHEDPHAFRLLVKWLYQGHLQDVSTVEDMNKKWDYAYACQNLYLLCESLKLPDLQNLAIDQFRKGCAEAGLVPGAEEIKPIYERTSIGSPFRKLVSKIAARQIMDPDSKRDASTYKDCFQANSDFAVDVLNAIRDGTEGMLLDDPTKGNGCQYHQHADGETCHKTVHFDDDDDITIVV